MSDLVLNPFQALDAPGGETARREESPSRPRRVFVDREGRVVVDDDAARERRRLAEIPPAVFA